MLGLFESETFPSVAFWRSFAKLNHVDSCHVIPSTKWQQLESSSLFLWTWDMKWFWRRNRMYDTPNEWEIIIFGFLGFDSSMKVTRNWSLLDRWGDRSIGQQRERLNLPRLPTRLLGTATDIDTSNSDQRLSDNCGEVSEVAKVQGPRKGGENIHHAHVTTCLVQDFLRTNYPMHLFAVKHDFVP